MGPPHEDSKDLWPTEISRESPQSTRRRSQLTSIPDGSAEVDVTGELLGTVIEIMTDFYAQPRNDGLETSYVTETYHTTTKEKQQQDEASTGGQRATTQPRRP